MRPHRQQNKERKSFPGFAELVVYDLSWRNTSLLLKALNVYIRILKSEIFLSVFKSKLTG